MVILILDKRKRVNVRAEQDRDEDEESVEDYYQELKEKHGSSFSVPQLWLWAKMFYCGTHYSLESPPPLPVIVGNQPKKTRKDALTEVMVDAASAFTKAMKSPSPVSPKSSPNRPRMGISPGKAVELKSKNLEQLRNIQQLFEENVLTAEEYTEQKQIVLDSIRKITN